MTAIFISKNNIAKNIYSFSFKTEKPISFTAGQFIELKLDVLKEVDDRGNKRWFTVSSAPGNQFLEITTKIVDTSSSFKKGLLSLYEGDTVSISQAMGDFVLPIDTSLPILMVAGGIGITPYLSILSHLSQGVNKNDYDLNLLYAVNGLAEALDLTDYQSLLSSFEIIDTSNKNNRLSPELLMSKYELLNQPIIYLSGPEPMVESIGKQLLILGVPEFKLVRDFFPGYTNY